MSGISQGIGCNNGSGVGGVKLNMFKLLRVRFPLTARQGAVAEMKKGHLVRSDFNGLSKCLRNRS